MYRYQFNKLHYNFAICPAGTKSHKKLISLTNKSMATSGVYRKYKIDKAGRRYSHIINPKTGYPSKSNILSVSVIANTCMEADAYATAFKVMGIDKVKAFLKLHPELELKSIIWARTPTAYLIKK